MITLAYTDPKERFSISVVCGITDYFVGVLDDLDPEVAKLEMSPYGKETRKGMQKYLLRDYHDQIPKIP